MLIRRFFTPGLAINSYLIYDEKLRRGAMIDPTVHIEPYLRQAVEDKVEISDILETHVHADFVSGSMQLKAALGNKPVIHCSKMGGKRWIPKYADQLVEDGTVIQIGELRLEALHTPGHTPEHLVWLAYDEKRASEIPQVAFTGDLLFVGSVGRPDLLGAEEEEKLIAQLYHSLFEKLNSLPDYLEIFPGHGAGSFCGKEIGQRDATTLGYEKRTNPFLMPEELKAWSQKLLKEMPAAPRYFQRMKKMNVEQMTPKSQVKPQKLSKSQLKEYLPDHLIIDIRPSETFAAAHFPGSLNIPLAPAFSLWAGSVLEPDQALIIAAEHSEQALAALQALRIVGLDNVSGIYEIHKEEKELASVPMINVKELRRKRSDLFILDVRTPAEWAAGHIEGAHHVELAVLKDSLDKLPRNKTIAVICHSGNRASLAASYLCREGLFDAKNVRGGMQAWNKNSAR